MENLTAANFQQTFDNQTLVCKHPLTFLESLYVLLFWPLFLACITLILFGGFKMLLKIEKLTD
jgi:hypothetical protein